MHQHPAPALVVMAAGMGSRFGGPKQMEAMTPQGEALLDFSVYDALQAGFGKIIIVIKEAIRQDFMDSVGKRLSRQCDIHYAYQEMDDLPPGYATDPNRVKPWGTGQAVWAARELCDRPFAVINADDFYGAEAFAAMHRFLSGEVTPELYAMVGYRLGNTLTPRGTVARGVCDVRDGYLQSITERTRIRREGEAAAFTEDGERWSPLALDTTVSMQIFGFHQSFMEHVGQHFERFLAAKPDPLKGEFLLPKIVGDLLAENQIRMRVLDSAAKWFGVTYAGDKPGVMEAIADLRRQGAYPETLEVARA